MRGEPPWSCSPVLTGTEKTDRENHSNSAAWTLRRTSQSGFALPARSTQNHHGLWDINSPKLELEKKDLRQLLGAFWASIDSGELIKGLVLKRDSQRSRKQGAKSKEHKKAISRAVKLGELCHSCETCQLSCEVQMISIIHHHHHPPPPLTFTLHLHPPPPLSSSSPLPPHQISGCVEG